MRVATWVVMLAALAMTGLSVRTLWQSTYAPGWVAVEAVIEESRLEPELRQRRGKGGAYTADIFRLEVIYRYSHLGSERRSARINLGSGLRGTSDALAPALKRYGVGARVLAWIQADDPTQSVLERGASSAEIVLAVLGLVVAALAYWLGRLPPQGRRARWVR